MDNNTMVKAFFNINRIKYDENLVRPIAINDHEKIISEKKVCY